MLLFITDMIVVVDVVVVGIVALVCKSSYLVSKCCSISGSVTPAWAAFTSAK